MITIGDRVVFSNGITTKYIKVEDIKEVPVIDELTGAISGNIIIINKVYGKKHIRPAMQWEKDLYY